MDHTETGQSQDGGSLQSRVNKVCTKMEALANKFSYLFDCHSSRIQEIEEISDPIDAILRIHSICVRMHHDTCQFQQELRILLQELEQVMRGVRSEDMVFVCKNGGDAVSDASLYTSGKLKTEKFLTCVYGLSKDQILQLGKNLLFFYFGGILLLTMSFICRPEQ